MLLVFALGFPFNSTTASGFSRLEGHWYISWFLGGMLACPLLISLAIRLAAVFDQYLNIILVLVLYTIKARCTNIIVLGGLSLEFPPTQ